MDGKGHLIVGVGTTILGITIFKNQFQGNEIIVPIVAGAISSLVADLDHEQSTLTRKLSIPLTLVLTCIYAFLFFYLVFIYQTDITKSIWILGVLVGLFFLKRFITRRLILAITGILVSAVGFWYLEMALWVILLGLFVTVASQLHHRGLTHSLLFLFLWVGIVWLGEIETGYTGMTYGAFLGYASHLLADHLFTKTKIKWFQPFYLK